MNADQAWQATIGQLQVDMPKAAFNTWVRDAEMISYEDGSFIIGIANAYARDWLESRLASTVKRMLTGMMNRSVEVRFVVWQPEGELLEPITEQLVGNEAEPPIAESHSPNGHHPGSVFVTRYSFENFVVGQSNRLAHAASLAAAENPGSAYNPLFLYGAWGWGKPTCCTRLVVCALNVICTCYMCRLRSSPMT